MYIKYVKNILLAIAFILPLTVVSNSYAANTKPFDNLIVFGDSLSDAGNGKLATKNNRDNDTGNNTWIKAQGKTGAPLTSLDPNSKTHPIWVNDFLKSFPYLKNRGAIYPSRLVKKLKLNPETQNIDYAYASADTSSKFLNDDISKTLLFAPYNSNCRKAGLIAPGNACVPGARVQIQTYLADVHHKPNPNTLFIIWSGGDDFIDDVEKLIYAYNSHDVKNKTGQAYARKNVNFAYPVYDLHQAVLTLIKNGVSTRQIYVVNLPNLAGTPAAIQLSKNNPLLLDTLGLVTDLFNSQLAWTLESDPKIHLPKSHIIQAHKLQQEVLKDPGKYGLTHVKEDCVAQHANPVCRGYIFFDDLHPTVLMGHIIAKGIKDGIEASL